MPYVIKECSLTRVPVYALTTNIQRNYYLYSIKLIAFSKSFTPSKSEITCGQNVGTKVVCGMILFFEKKIIPQTTFVPTFWPHIISELGGVKALEYKVGSNASS